MILTGNTTNNATNTGMMFLPYYEGIDPLYYSPPTFG